MPKLKLAHLRRQKTRKPGRIWQPPTEGTPMPRDVVIKLQRPLSDPDAAWLAYDRGRSLSVLIAQEKVPAAAKRAMRDQPKGYFNARVDGAQIVIGARVPDQPW